MDIALLALRAVVGLFFVGHGAQKLFGAFGGHGIAGTSGFFESIGVRPGRRNAMAAGTAELAGGALLVLGLMTPLAAAMIISVMVVAVLAVHAKNGPWVSDGGWEYNAVVIATMFALAGAGPGEVSLDDAIGWMPDITGTGWAFGALAAGAIGGLLVLATGRRGAADDATSAGTTEPATATQPAATAGETTSASPATRTGRFDPDRAADREQAERPGIPAAPR